MGMVWMGDRGGYGCNGCMDTISGEGNSYWDRHVGRGLTSILSIVSNTVCRS